MPLTPFQMMQGLFGNQMPSGGLSLLSGGLPANVLSLLGPQPLPGAAATPAIAGAAPTPAQPQLSPLQRANQIGALMNHNAYGTSDQEQLGRLGGFGFPMFTDPRMVQGYLGTMAQNGDDDAAEALRRMLRGGGGWAGGGYGGGEGGGTSGGGSGGAGQDASGQW